MRHGAAGIDLGSEVHWVCAPKINGKGRDVATFGATTPELEKMAFWLKERKVDRVALESTGVYWIAPHEVLERHGLELVLVNTGELARVPEAVCMLRTLVRDKNTLTAEASDWLRRMRKSLDQRDVRVLTTGAAGWLTLSSDKVTLPSLPVASGFRH